MRNGYRPKAPAVETWRRLRDQIKAEVLTRGYDGQRNTFVQYHGGKAVDASLMLIPDLRRAHGGAGTAALALPGGGVVVVLAGGATRLDQASEALPGSRADRN